MRMHRYANASNHQPRMPMLADRLTELYGSRMVRDWWPGVPRRCSACTGHLTAVGGTVERDSEVACLMCGRVAYEIRWDR